MERYTISKTAAALTGEIRLDGSKSISNRALVIRALSGEDFPLENLSTSEDTRLMEQLLSAKGDYFDAGAAGTTFRFLTAYLALQDGTQTLTGTERMKKRPVGVLVDALNALGARITYLEEEGYPPLSIHPPDNPGMVRELSVPAGTSSQYLSALLMIAPVLPQGLTLHLDGEIVSRPYLEMTLKMMKVFGVDHDWDGNHIHVPHRAYRGKPFRIEADWSAASYWYEMAAFSREVDLTLHGLDLQSLQGDSVLPRMMESFGISSEFGDGKVRLTRSGKQPDPVFEWDFLSCPDLAQTLAVTCAGLGVHGVFTGLQTLRIKETDRIQALQNELVKVQCFLSRLPERFYKKSDKDHYMIEGKVTFDGIPVFSTYKDHRMAMAFAPLAIFGKIQVEDPGVVVKSYPGFWEHLKQAGFEIA